MPDGGSPFWGCKNNLFGLKNKLCFFLKINFMQGEKDLMGIDNNFNEIKVGERIRLIRENKGIDIDDVASKTNLSRTVLKQIESDQISPPISTLIKIANALGVDLSMFFSEQKEDVPIAVVRGNERIHSPRRMIKGNKITLGYTYESLAHNKPIRHMEPFLITFEPKAPEDVVMFSHEGEEFHFVMEGVLEFSSDDTTIVLYPGDSIYFNSEILHGFRALEGKKAISLAVIYKK